MKTFLSAALPLLALILSAKASPMSARDIVTAHMTYTGPITPGGENVTLTGTAQDIHKQILVLNPTFNPEDFDVVQKARARSFQPKDIVPRTRDGLACNINTPGYTGTCVNSAIRDGIAYLNTLPGACGVGGHQATRVSCSYAAGIFMVNNNGVPTYAQCQYLADLATDILNACGNNIQGLNGQESDSAGYVVIVAGGYDC